MADEFDALIERVDDAGLRSELGAQIDRLRRRREFGLVFESHLPERVRLPDHPIRRGSKVVRRDAPVRETPKQVLSVSGGNAVLEMDGGSEEIGCDQLVVVAEFGEPIYPGFRRVGTIDQGGDKPSQVVIKGENYHSLEALRFSHAGKVDCIYIDPPYNNRSKDWKYNNDYVDKEDVLKHSKWLAMMHRRLMLAQQLLNPDGSALIITIDENEVHHLGILLEQTFPTADVQMVTSVISAKGAVRPGKFARVEEHIFFVTQGSMRIARWSTTMLEGSPNSASEGSDATEDESPVEPEPIEWLGLRRREPSSVRGARPNQFYAIFVHAESGHLHSVGNPIDDDVDRESVEIPRGTVALWPLRPDGTEMLWGLTPDALRDIWSQGFARVSNWQAVKQTGTVKYLPSGTIAMIRNGLIEVTGRAKDGSVEGFYVPQVEKGVPAKRVWAMSSHNAETGGTNILSKLIPGRRFDYPKSLYAVEDTLRFVVGERPDAVILDFFAGSGTTAHAVARLNRQDGGQRQSLLVTNNEVSAAEADELARAGHRQGDPEWERLGIFEYITRPRLEAAITGRTFEGESVKGHYKFIDEFPMGEGFEENVQFLELKYLDVEEVELDLAFEAMAPLLWLRAGGAGPIIDRRCDDTSLPKVFDLTSRYGILFNPDCWRAFVQKLPDTVTMTFVVTDSPSVFASVAAELPSSVEVVRLYENYLSSFVINRGR